MSTERDVNRIVRSWLEEGVSALPDRVLDTVLDQLPATPQRRAPWPVRRFGEMNTFTKFAVAAAAVALIAFVGLRLLPGEGTIGSVPSPSASPASSPTQAPSPSTASIVNHVGDFVPGTTYAIDDACCTGSSLMTFTIPATGWSAGDFVLVGKNLPGGSDVFDLFMLPTIVENIYTDGCNWHGTALDPPVGPTVDDLATALFVQAGPGASPPADVTVGGHPGKKVELSVPKGLDIATCEPDSPGGDGIFGRFVFSGGTATSPYTFGNEQHDTMYIFDVDGTRQVIDAMYLPNASAADRAELDQIVASIRFESSPASPSPSP